VYLSLKCTLQHVLVPYVQDIPNGLYQQDNARPHIARVSLEYLEHANVNLLPWPPLSPDLSPIEHVWDKIGQRLKNLARRPQTIQQLRHKIQVIWDALPQEEIDKSDSEHAKTCGRVRKFARRSHALLTEKQLNFMFDFSNSTRFVTLFYFCLLEQLC
jgi:hypothetical protein